MRTPPAWTIQVVMEAAPPTPPCFPDRAEWAAYLLQCQVFGKRAELRPFNANKVYRPEFNFCRDCLPMHANEKLRQGQCRPGFLRVVPIATAPAQVAACTSN